MSSTSEFNEEQLSAARAKSWHQTGEPLLTYEDAVEWIERYGLVPFAPTKLAMVGPSLVEATLGVSNDAPTAAECQIAREFVGRMVGEGAALPLNLLGGSGDAPDFIVSGPMFRYIFTMRGDKSWKQVPQTAGALKVSPLSLRVFEVLVEKGASTAAELANELGREVTEVAILRALTELWTMLRVVPLIGQGDKPSLWELTSRRFTKGIKAGVNAGQPTALSALVSVYLTQTLAATEDEIETFLSPLAARSRVREVLHALVGARELETTVVAGKTLMHVPGDLPDFAPLPVVEGAETDAAEDEAVEPVAESGAYTRAPRISTFAGEKKPYVARSRPAGARPSRPAGSSEFKPKKIGTGPRKAKAEGFGAPDRDRRPFKRDEQPSYNKPWDEERKARSSDSDSKPSPFAKFAKAAPKKSYRKDEGDAEAPKRPYMPRTGSSFDGPKRPYVKRESSYTPTSGGAGRTFDGPKRPYTPREGGSSSAKPAFRKFDAPKRPYTPREGGDATRTPYSSDRPKRTFTGAPAASSFDRPKRPYTPREGGSSFDGPKRPYVKREGGSFDGPKRPYTPREGGSFAKPAGDRGSFAARKPFGDSPRPFRPRTEGSAEGGPRKSFGDRPSFGSRPSFGDRPKFGGKPSFASKSRFSAKPAGKPKFGQGKMFDKKGPLPADGEGGLSPTGSKRKQQRKAQE